MDVSAAVFTASEMSGLERYSKKVYGEVLREVRRDLDAVIVSTVTFPQVQKHKSNSPRVTSSITTGITHDELDL